MSSRLAALAAEDAGTPAASLEKVRAKLRIFRDLTVEKDSLTARIEEIDKSINNLKTKELVDLFSETGIDKLGLEPEGNLPGYDFAAKPYYHANIKNDAPTAPAAYGWLEKNGHGDLIKRTYTIQFGKGEEAKALKFEKELVRMKVDYSSAYGVPWNSLTAFVREQTEKFEALPVKQQTKDKKLPLDLLGATVGKVVTIKPRK